MYTIIDWMLFCFVVEPGDGTVKTWDSRIEAEHYAQEELHAGLWEVVKIPPMAIAFKP